MGAMSLLGLMLLPLLGSAMPSALVDTSNVNATELSGRSTPYYKIQGYGYGDGTGCADYLWQATFNQPSTGCYSYDVSGTWSANIAFCYDDSGCMCTFFEKEGCQGNSWDVQVNGYGALGNCAYDGGLGIASFQCTVPGAENP